MADGDDREVRGDRLDLSGEAISDGRSVAEQVLFLLKLDKEKPVQVMLDTFTMATLSTRFFCSVANEFVRAEAGSDLRPFDPKIVLFESDIPLIQDSALRVIRLAREPLRDALDLDPEYAVVTVSARQAQENGFAARGY